MDSSSPFHRVLRTGAAAAALTTMAWAAPAMAAQWPMPGGDPAHSGVADGPSPPYRAGWETPVGGLQAGPVVAEAEGGALVVAVARSAVVAMDARTGEVRWRAPRRASAGGPPAVAGDLVVSSVGRHPLAEVVAIRLEDGREAWRARIGAPALGGPAVDGDTVYVGTRAGAVIAMAADTGERRWRTDLGGQVDAAPAVAGGAVVVTTEDPEEGTGSMVALEASSGEERWRITPDVRGIGASSPAVAGDLAVAGLHDGLVHAVDLGSGRERWTAPVRTQGAAAAFRPRQVPAATDPVLVADLAHVYALDPGDGEERWVFRLEGFLPEASPIVAGTAAVFGDNRGVAAAIDLDSGLLVWRQVLDPAAEPAALGAPAADGDRLYLALLGGRGRIVALEEDPGGSLLAEESPTTLFPLRALLNFTGAALALGAVLVLVFRFWIGRRSSGQVEAGDGD